MGTGSFPGVKSGRGVTRTPRPLLMSWSGKRKAIPQFLLWAVRPIQGCTLPFFLPNNTLIIELSSLNIIVLRLGWHPQRLGYDLKAKRVGGGGCSPVHNKHPALRSFTRTDNTQSTEHCNVTFLVPMPDKIMMSRYRPWRRSGGVQYNSNRF